VWNNNGAWRVSVASLRSHNWGLRNFTWMDVQVIETWMVKLVPEENKLGLPVSIDLDAVLI
jgi:hypothetical protein